ncbi:hypothetical protein LSAT2_004491 [Lamellibrachia satsuma]|nr:hypothetical protein LSAT2_004491 [Lamellibrachia satsuma]
MGGKVSGGKATGVQVRQETGGKEQNANDCQSRQCVPDSMMWTKSPKSCSGSASCGVCVNITGKASDIFSPLEQAEDSELDSEPKLLEVRGSWILEREVGAGCFGRVTLWRNMSTGEVLALKTYEKNVNRKPKNKDKLEARWTEEVSFTRKLSHENIIHGCNVPDILNDSIAFPPIAMEYCCGGSLAELLLVPENCCGLPEFRVIKIAHDISSAVEYLHIKQIIHRDIKPGNIILKDKAERTTYKLIDFGFAKDMMGNGSTRSVCGTPMYIAPEVVKDAKYTFSVDYWSLGCVIFKCITGEIPFPHYRMAKGKYWHDFVLDKPSDIIHVYMDDSGDIESSSSIPYPNQLCRVTQNKLEKWLCLMLDANGCCRGGDLTLDSRPVCFVVLDEIIATKIVHILSVPTNQLLSYSSLKEDETIHDLKLRVKGETTIPVELQELISSSGEELGESELIKDVTGEHGDNKMLLFLFPKCTMSHWQPMNEQPLFKSTELMLHGHKQKNHHALQTAWSEYLFYCNEVVKNYKQLLHAKNAAMLNLLQHHLVQMKKQDQMLCHWQNMQSRLSKIKHSIVSIGKKHLPGKPSDAKDERANKNVLELIPKVQRLSRENMLMKKSIKRLQTPKDNDNKAHLATLNDIAVKCSNLLNRVILDKSLKPGRGLLKPLVVEFQRVQMHLYAELFTQFGSLVKCKVALMELFRDLETTMQKMGIDDHIEGSEAAGSQQVTNTVKPSSSNVGESQSQLEEINHLHTTQPEEHQRIV